MSKILAALFIILLSISSHLFSCTRLFWNTKGAMIVGRTFDWGTHYNETIHVLPRGMLHQGQTGDNDAQWTARYGSIVVVEHDQNLEGITDGVNEKGLAAHLLSFKGAVYEQRDASRPSVSNLQWLQYYLDNFASVNELINHINEVQIIPNDFERFRAVPLHVAVEDADGDSAIIEFIQGKLVVFHHRDYTLMTNAPTYSEHLKEWANYEEENCPRAKIPLNDSSKSRFIRASCYMRALPAPENGDQALGMIASITENASVPYGLSRSEATWWHSLIDLTRKRYYFKSTRVHNLFWLDYAKIDFSRADSYRVINAHSASLNGDITEGIEGNLL